MQYEGLSVHREVVHRTLADVNISRCESGRVDNKNDCEATG